MYIASPDNPKPQPSRLLGGALALFAEIAISMGLAALVKQISADISLITLPEPPGSKNMLYAESSAPPLFPSIYLYLYSHRAILDTIVFDRPEQYVLNFLSLEIDSKHTKCAWIIVQQQKEWFNTKFLSNQFSATKRKGEVEIQ